MKREDLVLTEDHERARVIYRPWITRNGRRIYPKRARFFRLVVKA